MKNREFRMKNEGIDLFYDGRPNAHFDPPSVFQLFDLLNTFCSFQYLYLYYSILVLEHILLFSMLVLSPHPPVSNMLHTGLMFLT